MKKLPPLSRKMSLAERLPKPGDVIFNPYLGREKTTLTVVKVSASSDESACDVNIHALMCAPRDGVYYVDVVWGNVPFFLYLHRADGESTDILVPCDTSEFPLVRSQPED